MTEITNNHYSRHRTELANERTFLAYIRTALTLFVAGVSFMEFFQSKTLEIVGFLFIIGGVVLSIIGSFRFHQVGLHVKRLKDKGEIIDTGKYQ